MRKPNRKEKTKPMRLFKNLIQKYRLQPFVDILLFALIIYSFHLLWWQGGLKHFLSQFAAFEEAEEFLAHQVFLPAAWFVNHIIGYDIHTLHNTLYFPHNGYIAVEGSCSGLKQFYQWFFLMLLFPGPWKHKTWFIPLGLLAIHFFNIIRIILLSVVVMHWPAHWDFIHLWILRPMYYLVMFLLWVWWVEKFKTGGKTETF